MRGSTHSNRRWGSYYQAQPQPNEILSILLRQSVNPLILFYAHISYSGDYFANLPTFNIQLEQLYKLIGT